MVSKWNTGRIVYLSGAPRISTHSEAEEGGARAHILGTIAGFRQCNWNVETFIVGDRVPRNWVTSGSYVKKQGGVIKRVTVDIIRLLMRFKNRVSAHRELRGRLEFVYERYACMQALGLAFQRDGVPWILETNGLLFMEFSKDRSSLFFIRLARYLELLAYRRCDALICISEHLKKLILQEFDIPESKIIVLSNGVDTQFFQPNDNQLTYPDKTLNIGFVGIFLAWQALDVLLDAVYDLRYQGLSIQLTLIGNGPELENLKHQVARLSLQSIVYFPGRLPRDKIPSAIAQFDLGYSGHVSTQSGEMYMSPLKMYEYMAMAKPVLASRNADSEKLVIDGETGFFFEAGNKESLKSAIAHAINNKESFDVMGQKGRKLIEEEHSWQSRVKTLFSKLDIL